MCAGFYFKLLFREVVVMLNISKWLIIITVVFSATSLLAEEDGKVYGKGVTLEDTTQISDILATPDDYVGQRLMVKGRIVDVCKKRGCWMELAGDQEFQTLRIKVKDGEIVFPLQSRGKLALAEGVFEKIELSMEQTLQRMKHHAEEHGETFNAEEVKEPMTYYQLRGLGAVIFE
ncbi:MAG: DUF4920 domain-containing protein [Caldithrix sp.]|nr:DUF4920 domain-containing protein [Caldithrix sp.]